MLHRIMELTDFFLSFTMFTRTLYLYVSIQEFKIQRFSFLENLAEYL